MDLFIISLISIVICIYIMTPIFNARELFTNSGKIDDFYDGRKKIMVLEAEKENIYSELRDIEFDYKLGKITQDDYQQLTDKYKIKAAEKIKAIEIIKKNK